MIQTTLFDNPPKPTAYEVFAATDKPTQQRNWYHVMSDGAWRTPSEMAHEVSAYSGKTVSENSVTARFRTAKNFRDVMPYVKKEKRLRVGCKRLYEYRMIVQ